MAIHLVTFRIKSGPDYDARRTSLIEAAQALSNKSTWEETTSVIIMENALSAADLHNQLWLKSSLRKEDDICLVINLSAKGDGSWFQTGASYPATLGALLNAR